MTNRRYERLQGALWHTRKGSMKLVNTKISDNGNIKGFYRDTVSGKMFTHWMNDEEKREYNGTGYSV